MKTKMQKIIIDTDPGHDDALALLLLLKSQRFDVLAVTTVAGNATIEDTTPNAQAVLDALGSTVPVYSGSPAPLQRELMTATVHGEGGLAGFDTSDVPLRLTADAPEKIVELIRQYPGEVTIVALGPLSNVARAFVLDPEIPSLLQRVVMMGGAIDVPGNMSRTAEFNFFVDPDAAKVVFEADVPKMLVPLDLCNEVVLQVSDFRAIANVKIRTMLVPMMEHFSAGLMENEGTKGILVYDALAAYFLMNEVAFETKMMDVKIETQGLLTAGMCVVERREYKERVENVEVALGLDQEVFRKEFFEVLGR